MAALEAPEEEGVRRQKFFKILLPGTFESTLLGRNQHGRPLCFAGTGWRTFVRASRLAPGHMLLFEHRGGLHFAVDLFDHSGCLKDDDQADAENMESGNAAAWRRAFAGAMKKKRRKRSRSPAASAAAEGSCGQEEERQEDPLRLQIARPYQLGFLDVSKSFCERMGWTSSRSAELSLLQRDDDEDEGRRWAVNVKVSGNGGMICGGWLAFAKDNDLSLNDTCVFKPPQPRRLFHDDGSRKLLQVQILRST
ncbi:hypothetical protein E2562_028944 [Oryza meyeriana var. granulata]|uniref:TF-B3 domain-containing protein n=1 Tax=Oryza meyeriana var. granulata TaxID=110450 RepID=A0A6G1DPZ1_9ORYZ|nr:hypothetical protein E2562_028944 [Oryza meyeriana var. granulata]